MEFPKITLNETDQNITGMFGKQGWIVGGRPRDEFFAAKRGQNIISKDNDYVISGRSIDQILVILRRNGWKAELVGSSFGVIKSTKGNLEADIAVPRREISTGSGHKDFKVEFGPGILIDEDLPRRDITWNSVAYNLKTSEVKHVPSSLYDLDNGIIRTNSEKTILEDPLRMMRIVQNLARFGGSIHPETAEQIKRNAALILTIPGERIQEELNKMMLRSPRPSVGWNAMNRLGLLQYVAPEYVPAIGLKQNTYHDLDVFGHQLKALDRAALVVRQGGLDVAFQKGNLDEKTLAKLVVYGAFLHDVGKPETAKWVDDDYGNSFHGHENVGAAMTRRILDRWKFSDFENQAIAGLVKHHMYAHQEIMRNGSIDGSGVNRSIRRLLRSAAETQPLSVDVWWETQFLVRQCDVMGGKKTAVWHENDTNHQFYRKVHEVIQHVPALSVSNLEINGPIVIEAYINNNWEPENFQGGKSVSTGLSACLDAVVDDPEKNNRKDLLKIACKEVSERYYISNPDLARGTTQDIPVIYRAKNGNKEACFGVVISKNEENFTPESLISGGFVRVEQDGKILYEERGLGKNKMVQYLKKYHVDIENAANVLTCMRVQVAEPPKPYFENENFTIKIDGLLTNLREVSIINKKTHQEYQRIGIPDPIGLHELLDHSPELEKNASDMMEQFKNIDMFSRRARESINSDLKNWLKKEQHIQNGR